MAVYQHAIHQGRDDPIELLITDKGAAANLSGVQRMVFTVNGESVDSDDDPGLFDWATGTEGVLIMKPGSALTASAVNEAYTFAELVIYDLGNTNGITVFSECTDDKLKIKVCS